MILDEIDFSSALKFTNLTIKEDIQIVINDFFQDKLALRNATIFYHLAEIFNLTKFSKTVLNYIERCFKMTFENNNFMELDYALVLKLLSSSELNIDTELEVFQAANKWLSHNIEERSKFAKSLLLKVRLPLLSEHTLKYIVNKPSLFSKNEDCVVMLKEFIVNKENMVRNNSNWNSTHRYSDNNNSKILICGGRNTRFKEVVGITKQIEGNNFKNVRNLSSMKNVRKRANAVYLNGEVYVFCGRDKYFKMVTIEKHSPLDDNWSNVTRMYDGRTGFCTCSFMDKIYIFGGYNKYSSLHSALQFDPNFTNYHKWTKIARMDQAREDAACAVFEGNIVVCGGNNDNNRDSLNTVESYDVIGNEWSPMPNMINGAAFHSLVVVKNKLFVIADVTKACEVYESSGKKFVAIKSKLFFQLSNKVINVGNKIYVFSNDYSTSVLCYDVEKNEWSEDSCEIINDLVDYSIVNIPSF